MTNYTKKTMYGAGVLFVTSVIAALFAYLFRLLLARELPLEEYGFFFAMTAFFGIVTIFRDLGINEAAVFFIPRIRNKGKLKAYVAKTIKIGALMSTISTIVIIALSGFLIEKYFHYGAAMTLILFAVGYLFNTIELNFQTLFNAFQYQTAYAFQNLIRNLLILVGAFIVFKYSPGINSLIISNIIAYFIIFVVVVYLFFKKVLPDFFGIKEQEIKMKKVFFFGISAIMAYVGFLFMTTTDTLMLTYLTDLKNVALYNAAIPIISLMLHISSAAVIVMIPIISELWSKKQIDKVISLWRQSTKYVFITVIPIACLLITFPDLILRILFGEKFVGASVALIILSIGAIAYSIAIINTNVMLATEGPKKNIITYFSAAIVNIILNVLFIPRYGIAGAAAATTISYLMMLVMSLRYASQKLKKGLEISKYILTVAASLAFIVMTIILKNILNMTPLLETAVIVCISGLTYLLLIFLFRVVTIAEIMEIKKQILKQ